MRPVVQQHFECYWHVPLISTSAKAGCRFIDIQSKRQL
jgi:hypothetical protein